MKIVELFFYNELYCYSGIVNCYVNFIKAFRFAYAKVPTFIYIFKLTLFICLFIYVLKPGPHWK